MRLTALPLLVFKNALWTALQTIFPAQNTPDD